MRDSDSIAMVLRRAARATRWRVDAGYGTRWRRDQALVWHGLDDAAPRVPSGVYFTRLHTAEGDWTRKLVVLR